MTKRRVPDGCQQKRQGDFQQNAGRQGRRGTDATGGSEEDLLDLGKFSEPPCAISRIRRQLRCPFISPPLPHITPVTYGCGNTI